MELTDEEKATLEMLGLSPEQYQEQFPNKNEAGQRINWAGQALDDFFINMLEEDSRYDFAKGVGLGSVRPITVTEEGQEMAQTVAEIMAGFTPAGPAIDIKDMYQALENDDIAGLAMAGFGLVPGLGDTAKALVKIKKSDPEAATKIVDEVVGRTISKMPDKFKSVKPESRHLKLTHASTVPDLKITPTEGRIAQQSRRRKPVAGFYTYPEVSRGLPTREATIERASDYVKQKGGKTAHIYEFEIDPNANFVEYTGPAFGMTRIRPEDAQSYKDQGIDIIISKADQEELIVLNPDVIIGTKMQSSPLQ